MSVRIVKNYPSPRLMETIGATNQKPAEAIGELVANSFDARVEGEKVNITIKLRPNKIVIIDDGKGMNGDVLEKAVCIAEDMSKHIERGEGAKGHFGMGFKTSCSTLGRKYQIYTRPIDDTHEYHVSFDIDDYSNRPSNADAWNVEIYEEAPSPKSPLGSMAHGTAFVIGPLRRGNAPTGAILEYLGEAFKMHLKDGDTITICSGEGQYSAIPKEYQFIKETLIDIHEEVEIKGKTGEVETCKIDGWVALDSSTHNDGLYGFNIYRNNQLLESWNKSWFKPHLMTSRIIGEVNMDFLEATFYKQGIQEMDGWDQIKIHMEEFLKPVVAASRAISRAHNINKPTERRRIIQKLNDDYETGTSVEQESENGVETRKSKEKTGGTSINDKVKNVVREESVILEGEKEIRITYTETEEDSYLQAPFDYSFSEEDDFYELEVIVNNAHPLWAKKVDSTVMRILATSDALLRALIDENLATSREANKIRKEWINQKFVEKGSESK